MWVPKLDFGPKNGQIWPKICICGHFGPNIDNFGPFGHMPNQKTMRSRCLCGFSVDNGYRDDNEDYGDCDDDEDDDRVQVSGSASLVDG